MFNALRQFVRIFFSRKKYFTQEIEFNSFELDRNVRLSIFAVPHPKESRAKPYSLLLINDGQDLDQMQFEKTIIAFHESEKKENLLSIGIHAGDRMQEYGTASQPDYAKRGKKAGAYTQFITTELIPFLESQFNIIPLSQNRAFAGFSLGALSALDIVWSHPKLFGRVGVFSGSLWWRSKAFNPKKPDANLIMHQLIEKSNKKEGLKFWFQTGTKDEIEDRNNNGIIDSIDDTLSLIHELKTLGYTDQDISYTEVEGGEHNPDTWAKVMPVFLNWLIKD